MKPINETIPFKGIPVHIIPGSEGVVEWVSLHDLCRILKRKEMVQTGEAVSLCKTSTKFPVYTNGKLYWFIEVYDIQTLANKVRKDNKSIAALCNELLEWAGKLPAPKAKAVKRTPPKREIESEPGELMVFQYKNQPISFKASNGKTYINATEMARSFKRNPREWLNLAEAKRFRESLVEQGKSENLESQIITSRGSVGTTWIEESLGLEFSRWLSPEFANWCNDRMQELLTQGVVVLENQNNDLYTTSYGLQKVVPKNYKEALQQLVAAEEQIEKQLEKIEEDKPKVEFYDSVIGDKDSFRTSIIADELGISLVKLYAFLREERIVRWVKKHYEAYPNYQSLQCDHPYYWTNPKTGKSYAFAKTKRWTKAGREFVLELYRRKNPK